MLTFYYRHTMQENCAKEPVIPKIKRTLPFQNEASFPVGGNTYAMKKQKQNWVASRLRPFPLPVHKMVLLKHLLKNFPHVSCSRSSIQIPENLKQKSQRQILFFLTDTQFPVFEQRTLILVLHRYFLKTDQFANTSITFLNSSLFEKASVDQKRIQNKNWAPKSARRTSLNEILFRQSALIYKRYERNHGKSS